MRDEKLYRETKRMKDKREKKRRGGSKKEIERCIERRER